jgi:hypothetical protein
VTAVAAGHDSFLCIVQSRYRVNEHASPHTLLLRSTPGRAASQLTLVPLLLLLLLVVL